jgi:uncharacterized membrane protein YgcG
MFNNQITDTDKEHINSYTIKRGMPVNPRFLKIAVLILFFSLFIFFVLSVFNSNLVNGKFLTQLTRSFAAGSASLTTLSNVTIYNGATYDLPIMLTTDAAISGVDVIITFDKSKLILENISPGAVNTSIKTFLPLNSSNAFDSQKVINAANQSGIIEFGAATFNLSSQAAEASFQGSLPQNNPLVLLRFKAVALGQSPITFVSSPGSTTDSNVVDSVNVTDILSSVQNGVINITTATPVPTATPTPTIAPTSTPTSVPTSTPTSVPTATPTTVQTVTPVPTTQPTVIGGAPSPTPTNTPTSVPTATPTQVSTATPTPTATPSIVPTKTPAPTATPVITPVPTSTVVPTITPAPTIVPTTEPTSEPTNSQSSNNSSGSNSSSNNSGGSSGGSSSSSGSTSSSKTGDVNSDGKVNIFDLSLLLSRWSTSDSSADLNKNGRVDIFDLSILLSKWGS